MKNTMFKHKGVHVCTWHQDTLGRGEGAGQTWQAQTTCEGLLGTFGRVPCEKEFPLPPPAELRTHPGEAGDIESEWAMFVPPLSR